MWAKAHSVFSELKQQSEVSSKGVHVVNVQNRKKAVNFRHESNHV